MPSLRYHAGRMVLKQEANGWSVTIKTKSEKVRYALSAVELQDAVMQAEHHLQDHRARLSEKVRWWSCSVWYSESLCQLVFEGDRRVSHG